MKPKINIALDISPLSDGNRQRGMGYYLRHLVPALENEINSNPDYKCFKLLTFTPPQPILSEAHILHVPYFQPFFPSLAPVPKLPFIVTVPDLIPLELPHLFPVGIKGSINWYLQKKRLLKASYIITISHFSKYSITRHTSFPKDRIYTTWLSAPDNYHPVTDTTLLNKVKKLYHLPPRFVLYVGDINTSKNIPLLVKTCQSLNYPLVIAGAAATKSQVENNPWNKDLLWLQNHKNQVTLTGFIPDSDMPALYSLATLYCQPSLSEGFGLTPVEAMACGCPVVYAIGSSLTEVMDYQGEFFDPTSQISLSHALTAVWSSPSYQKKLSQDGLTRASVFSWRQTALQTLSTYQLLSYEIK
ncbi:MAG: glycosyltransferase family 1 protein [Candidatus Shapirobacteria bacterium]